MDLERTRFVRHSLFLNLHSREAGALGLRTLDVIELQGAGSDGKGLSAYLLAKERTGEKRLNPLKDSKCLPHLP